MGMKARGEVSTQGPVIASDRRERGNLTGPCPRDCFVAPLLAMTRTLQAGTAPVSGVIVSHKEGYEQRT
jgi:hypothetical protein